ncbi:uncharacterized protein EV420DRAFT_1649800 [Desarmillaria tabescens]|uniref:Uncharacterized protein n=1 Tax=Armillaria tabescens TaxID=1929756 RepID=A0AA39JH35_ARMTA|nr:uncharacterized protein EV420DRAFT_1649800 [Desarmillaria tabescens]KAK0442002.1 hypothetical protein EV420DRAFT_1649800 [Desarmillaria tabescens]
MPGHFSPSMETSNSICYLADDATPPAPMVLSLCTTDLFFTPKAMPWAIEHLSHSRKLKLLAGRLQHTCFAPYLLPSCQSLSLAKGKKRDPTPIPLTLRASIPPAPWRDKEKGRGTSMPPCDDEPPLNDDVSDEESTEEEPLSSSQTSISSNSHPTIQRVLIAQPKGVRNLGLVQLGAKLNWEGNTYQQVKYAEKIFPVYLKTETSASGQDQTDKDAFKDAMMQEFDDPLSNYVNVCLSNKSCSAFAKNFQRKHTSNQLKGSWRQCKQPLQALQHLERYHENIGL